MQVSSAVVEILDMFARLANTELKLEWHIDEIDLAVQCESTKFLLVFSKGRGLAQMTMWDEHGTQFEVFVPEYTTEPTSENKHVHISKCENEFVSCFPVDWAADAEALELTLEKVDKTTTMDDFRKVWNAQPYLLKISKFKIFLESHGEGEQADIYKYTTMFLQMAREPWRASFKARRLQELVGRRKHLASWPKLHYAVRTPR